jgi:hypothetical protein
VSLRRKYSARAVRPLLEQLQGLADDARFWNHRRDGLAVLSSPETFQVFDLHRPVAELAIVADSFHIKPLVREFQSADRYQVLCLNRRAVRLYDGGRDHLDEVELTDVPATITEAVGEEVTGPHLTVASYGLGSGAPHAPRGAPASYHGHGSRKDELDIDTERFFRVIDRAILEHHSRPSGLPLLLAALPQYHALFRTISRNPFLLPERIELNPDTLSTDRLREEAWAQLEPRYHARLARLVDDFQAARARRLGSDDISQVARAVLDGQVDTLLVEAEHRIPGTLDRATGRVQHGDLNDPKVDDLLDDLAETTLWMGGQVLVIPGDRMPTPTGLAAIYRF